MQISSLDLEKYKALHLQHYGVTLSDEEAYESATKLLALFKILFAEKNDPARSFNN
jgi:hypothetical protein